jgi:hypothetical protein
MKTKKTNGAGGNWMVDGCGKLSFHRTLTLARKEQIRRMNGWNIPQITNIATGARG